MDPSSLATKSFLSRILGEAHDSNNPRLAQRRLTGLGRRLRDEVEVGVEDEVEESPDAEGGDGADADEDGRGDEEGRQVEREAEEEGRQQEDDGGRRLDGDLVLLQAAPHRGHPLRCLHEAYDVTKLATTGLRAFVAAGLLRRSADYTMSERSKTFISRAHFLGLRVARAFHYTQGNGRS